MRTLPDRIRHTVLFEGLALILVAFGGAAITGQSLQTIGLLGIMFSLLAMSWNMIYNYLFDLWDHKYRHMAKRTLALRVVHAILFELVLLCAGMFIIAWWLEMGLWQALLLDIGLSGFFLIYAFAFNWSYDAIFPITRAEAGTS